MSQRHLYGSSYDELDPPLEWEDLTVEATINDDSEVSESVSNGVFTFIGSAAEYIQNTHIPAYGVFEGVPYRIESKSNITGDTVIIFDGFIRLSDRVILSRSNPIMFTAPIEALNNNATVFDQMAIITQGLLKAEGFWPTSDAVDIPTIKESKKNFAERSLILGQLGYTVVSTFIQMVQNFLSAVSDTLGASVLIGLVEMLLFFTNSIITINSVSDQVIKHKDLLFPDVTYYKGLKFRNIIERAAQYLGYDVDFGGISDWLDNVYIMPSQNGFPGFPAPAFPVDGILKTQDSGYLVNEAIDTLQKWCNTRQAVIGNTIHIKNKKDPSWSSAPVYNAPNALLESTSQYQNGTIKEDTDRVHAVVYLNYQIDASDTHTLTEKSGDSYEIHRRSISSPNPRMNTLRGIKEVNIPYAMAVRKSPFDNLLDLFYGISSEIDLWLDYLQAQVTAFLDSIPASAGVDTFLSELLSFSDIGSLVADRTGALKIDDDAFAIPKVLWMEPDNKGVLKIPENFKDFIGMEAVYNMFHLPDSPADVNDFKGQYVLRNEWRIPFGTDDFIQVQNNPYYNLVDGLTKFNRVSWTENAPFAITDSEQNTIFDTNITEISI